MPRTRRLCPRPACPQLTPCPQHSGRPPDSRPSAHRRGYDGRHTAWRRMVLAREPECRVCGAPATVADHIVPLRAGGTWELTNGQALCASCHNRKTATQDGGFGRRSKRLSGGGSDAETEDRAPTG